VAGAKAFGYRTCWCNRLAAPMERLGVSPDLEVRTLDEILAKLS
jgi:2-haloacid dehalogenase